MITRRNFVKTSAALAAGAALRPRLSFGADDIAKPCLALPTPAQITWQDCEIGLLYSFDLAIAAGDTTGNNAARKTWDPNLYQPRKLDTDQWIEAAKACGARYAIFTATHFNGFMQWQSDAYPYGLKQTSWRDGKGDVVADFVASCRKAGIKPGIYFSVHRNVYQQVWGHYVDWGKGRGTPEQEKFNRIAEKQMEEICSKYGPLVQIWFDAGTKTPSEGGPDMLPIFEKHQPDSVFYSSAQRSDHRWVGNEQGNAGSPCYATMPGPEQGALSHSSPTWKRCLGGGDPAGTVWSPAMVDIPLRGYRGHNWFYKPDQDQIVYPPDVLMRMYYTSVGRNANLIIGGVIKPDGTVPEADVKAMTEFGKMLRERFLKPVASVADMEGSEIALDLPGFREIDCVVLQEQIAHGERVRDHVLEGLASEAWVPLAQGKVIGHKWIYRFKPQTVSRLRLKVAASLAAPMIRSFACYKIGEK
ncbi:MAG: alpha-L-fucosidase [Candidatus Sumerlaeota bacterium]|nr:alpha-L-fucosidase [Candidatus Sumerlaeota bacterium]